MSGKMQPALFKALRDQAQYSMSRAYAPYSKFHVGASILTLDDKIFSGCNVENAAYPEGMCAEAGAISAMIVGGSKHIRAMCIIANSNTIISPCGGCRQKMLEFSTPETEIFLCSQKKDYKVFSINQILPFSFKEFDQ